MNVETEHVSVAVGEPPAAPFESSTIEKSPEVKEVFHARSGRPIAPIEPGPVHPVKDSTAVVELTAAHRLQAVEKSAMEDSAVGSVDALSAVEALTAVVDAFVDPATTNDCAPLTVVQETPVVSSENKSQSTVEAASVEELVNRSGNTPSAIVNGKAVLDMPEVASLGPLEISTTVKAEKAKIVAALAEDAVKEPAVESVERELVHVVNKADAVNTIVVGTGSSSITGPGLPSKARSAFDFYLLQRIAEVSQNACTTSQVFSHAFAFRFCPCVCVCVHGAQSMLMRICVFLVRRTVQMCIALCAVLFFYDVTYRAVEIEVNC